MRHPPHGDNRPAAGRVPRGPVLGSGPRARIGSSTAGNRAPEGFDRAPVAPDAGRHSPSEESQVGTSRCDEREKDTCPHPPSPPSSTPTSASPPPPRSSTTAAFGSRERHLRDRPARPAGRRLRRRHQLGDTMRAVGHHGRQAAQGAVRLLPADGRRRGADVRRRAHPRLVLPPRGPPERGRDPHLPPDRPPAAPDLRQGPAQRGPGRRSPSWRWTREHLYDVRRDQRARRLSTQLSGLPFSGPVGGTRVALIDGQWVGFPTHTELERRHLRHGRGRPRPPRRRRRDHDGRGRGHREDDRADRRRRRRRRPRRSWPRASRPPSRPSRRCATRRPRWPRRPPSRSPEFPRLPRLPGRRLRRRRGRTSATSSPQALQIAGKHEREDATDALKDEAQGRAGRPVRGPREGDRRRLPRADQEGRRASASCATRSASTAAASPTSGRCRPRSRSSRGCTARRCSSAARPRSSASPR